MVRLTFRLIGSIQNISTPFIDHRDYSKKSYETGFRSVKQKKPETLLGKSINRWRDYSTVIQ